jgi:hypothetical protein
MFRDFDGRLAVSFPAGYIQEMYGTARDLWLDCGLTNTGMAQPSLKGPPHVCSVSGFMGDYITD